MAGQGEKVPVHIKVAGAPPLDVLSLSAHERLGAPFLIEIMVLADDAVEFAGLLGSDVSITMEQEPGISREFHGVLFEATLAGTSVMDRGVTYVLQARPRLAVLDLGGATRFFQDKSAIDIIKEILKLGGVNDYTLANQKGGKTVRNYCVQYDESDFDFISRLMEEEGLYYYHQHTAGGHKLVICDNPGHHTPGANLKEAVVRASASVNVAGAELQSWSRRVRPAVNKVSLRDNHFTAPKNPMAAEAATTAGASKMAARETYQLFAGHGALLDKPPLASGTPYAETRLAEHQAERELWTGSGTIFAVATGTVLKITNEIPGSDPPRKETNTFLVTGAAHQYSIVDGEAHFQVSIEGVPSTLRWAVQRHTPKPRAHGPQTGLIVGPKGETIYVDDHGRVRVRFHWDRETTGDNPDLYSCWIRVSQAWAGDELGVVMHPRIGQEVIVDFLDGDPDRPIITGRVYNPDTKAPMPPVAEKTRSTWKSRTVGDVGQDYSDTENPPKSGERGSNELRFEDKGGSEHIYLHGQRDFEGNIRRDEKHKTGRNLTARIGLDRKTDIKRHETTTIEEGDEKHTVKKGSRTTVIHVDETATIETGNSATTVSTGNYSVDVSAGKVKIEAALEILLKVGTSTVKISPEGIEIKGMTVKIKGETMLSAESLKTDVKGSAMTTITGGVVMIN
ncbi:type VI secretion system Vgr family protein [Caulobacter sp. LARHSG274]